MPRMDGFEVAARIRDREQSRRIPILFISASVFDLENAYKGYAVGAVDCLQKPVDAAAVRAKVSVFVELFRQRRQLERQAEAIRQSERRERERLRRHSDRLIFEREAEFQATFDEAPIGIGQVDHRGRWTRLNASLCEILRRPPRELRERPIGDLAAPDEGPKIREALARVLRQDFERYQGDHRFLGPGGETIWGSLRLAPLKISVGRVRRVVATLADITERRRIEESLREAIRARDEFLSIAAHGCGPR